MRDVDSAILALLEALPLTVYDGEVPADTTDTQVVTADIPYLVFYSDLGLDSRGRMGRRPTRRAVRFQVTYVGSTREQAKWAGERQRTALSGTRLTLPGHKAWVISIDTSLRVRPDDDVRTPDGRRLFYGADQYTTAVTLT
jgi:hypothetical protein